MNDQLAQLLQKANAQPTRKHPDYVEDKLQIACKAWFDKRYRDERGEDFVILLHHSPNEGKLMQHDRDGAKRKAMGMRAGFPDFIFLHPNRFYSYLAIELKSPKGRQSDHQKEYQRAVELSGGRYVVVRSIDEFMTTIENYIDNI